MNILGNIKSCFYKIRRVYRYLIEKKYTTLAGTMTFFLILSAVPLVFWLTLLFGKTDIDFTPIFELGIFSEFKDIFIYILDSAKSATVGASAVLLITTLYSSTTLFYHMRRSGEIIYGVYRQKGGILIRLSALLLIAIIMFLFISGIILFTVGNTLFRKMFPTIVAQIAAYGLLGLLDFCFLIILNLYICPYRIRIHDTVWGSLLTLLLSGMTSFGFSVYVHLNSMQKLYGAAVFLILFLLWIYTLMVCFIIGVICNCGLLEKEKFKRMVHKKF